MYIDVKIKGNIAQLKPESNWHGEENIVFTATDNKGGFADSDVMTLKVVPKHAISFFGYWNAYCMQVAYVLLVLIFIAWLLILEAGFTVSGNRDLKHMLMDMKAKKRGVKKS